MGTTGSDAARFDQQELEGSEQSLRTLCVGCGRPLATVLEQLGSLRCHDCRDVTGNGSGNRSHDDSLGGPASRR
jgi:hypothetical protein